ncbi:MAG: hypothetical protein ACTHQ3_18970 [Motilibacteraceae bacterium]
MNGTHRPKRARAEAPVEPVAPLLLSAASRPAPFPATVAALGQLQGRPVSREALDPLAAWLAANAVVDGPGTMRPLDAAAALAGVAPAAVEVVVPAARTPRPRTAPSTAKPATAPTAAVTAGPAVAPAPDPDLDRLSAEAQAPVLAYRPRGVSDAEWAPLAGLARRLMAGYASASAANAGPVGSHVATFLRWAARWPGRVDGTAPLRAEEFLVPGLVDADVATLTAPDASKATVHSVLRRAVRSLRRTGPGHRRLPAGRCPLRPRRVRPAGAPGPQPAHRRRAPRALSLLVDLGLGAGLAAQQRRSRSRRGHLRGPGTGTRSLTPRSPPPGRHGTPPH